jgi:alpha-L-arabinofuranosidase
MASLSLNIFVRHADLVRMANIAQMTGTACSHLDSRNHKDQKAAAACFERGFR